MASPRVVGVDLARGVAIIGMFIAHAIPRVDDAEILADGRSSILFATLAGVSLGLITGARTPTPRGSRGDRVTGIVLRALVLFLLGVALSTLGSGIAIILDYYALMFLLLLPVLFAPRWLLAVVAAVIVFAVPPWAAVVAEDRSSSALTLFLEEYLLTGYYPALVWLPLLLVGLICARSGLERGGVQFSMAVGGAVVSALGYGSSLVLSGVSAEAHSGSTAELLGSGGLAVSIIGIAVWALGQRGPVVAGIRFVVSPVIAIGSMALTIYTLQILLLAVFAELRDSTGAVDYPGWPLLIGMTIGSLVFATLWRRYLGRGPLERLLSALTRAPASRVDA